MTDQELRHLFATDETPDPGFAFRVLAALPRRRVADRWRLVWLLSVCLLGGALSLFGLSAASALPLTLVSAGLPVMPVIAVLILLALAATALAVASQALD